MNSIVLIVVLAAMAAFGVLLVSSYNRLIDLRNQLERAWSNIDVILKQRFDELPQLMKVIEQVAGYEGGLLKDLAAAKQHYGAARSIEDKMGASTELSTALRGVFALGEAFPQLQANQNFLQLQTRVSALEEAIADRRESYNECVATFNARIEQFPDVLAASMLGYQRQNLFRVPEAETVRPDLTMNLPTFGSDATRVP